VVQVDGTVSWHSTREKARKLRHNRHYWVSGQLPLQRPPVISQQIKDFRVSGELANLQLEAERGKNMHQQSGENPGNVFSGRSASYYRSARAKHTIDSLPRRGGDAGIESILDSHNDLQRVACTCSPRPSGSIEC
jgi:hypothetical protein